MCSRSKDKEHSFRIAAVIILANLLLCASIGCIYKTYTNDLETMYTGNIEERKVQEWDIIEMYIKELYRSLSYEMDDLSVDIEQKIIDTYDDLDVLKEELDLKDYSGLYKVVSPLIKDLYLSNIKNDRNDIFVATNDGIIADFSLSQIPYWDETTTSNPTILSWQQYIDTSSNSDLTKESVNLILDQVNCIIFNERFNTNGDHMIILQPYLSEMKKVYIEEGIDSLRNYTFLVPSYITDDGDIFGNIDIEHGYRYTTYKIIIVQEFNIFDQLKNNYPNVINENRYESIDNMFLQKLTTGNIIGLLIIAELFASIILSCKLFNLHLLIYKKK